MSKIGHWLNAHPIVAWFIMTGLIIAFFFGSAMAWSTIFGSPRKTECAAGYTAMRGPDGTICVSGYKP